jgi:hypothetical protein
MMVNLASLVIFDPTTATLYAASDLPMVMNGNALQLTLPGSSMPETSVEPKRRRSRSARSADKKLSKAFKEANARYRKKDGSLRTGRTQADIARLAHKLRKKM